MFRGVREYRQHLLSRARVWNQRYTYVLVAKSRRVWVDEM